VKRLTHAIIIVDGKLPAIAGSLRRSPTRIDRLARSIGDLQDIVRAVRARGASLKATEQPIDTSTAAGKCFLDMLGVFAEFETNLRRERQLEGIAKAKAAGVYKGRPASIDAVQVRAMKAQGLGSRKRSRLAGLRSIAYWRPDDGRALNAPMIATSPSPPYKGFPIRRASSPPLGLASRPRRRSSMPRIDIRISRGPSPRRRRRDGSKSARSCQRRPPPPQRR
jgi:Resolvase, N terminal domain